MAMIGHPILGDVRYTYGYVAQRERWLANRGAQAAAAVIFAAAEPREGEITGPGAVGKPPQSDEVQSESAQAGREAHGPVGCRGPPKAELEAEGDTDDASSEQSGGGRGRGVEQHLCLWAVEVQLQHPVTQEAVLVQLQEPAMYAEVRAVHEEDWTRQHAPC